MTTTIVENIIEIPENVNFTIEGSKIIVSGEKGQVVRDFSHTRLNFDYTGDSLRVWTVNPRKKEASLVKTIAAHVRNMIKGVLVGFTYKLKIVFIHFPMTIKLQGRKLIIQNFIGERSDRTAELVGNVQVTIEREDIIVHGPDIEEVAQTAANIQQSTKIRRKDLRKFLDGIYVYSKE